MRNLLIILLAIVTIVMCAILIIHINEKPGPCITKPGSVERLLTEPNCTE